ncbi:type II toxin-antitoxin system VapB family antitoxin [Haliscomenobacter sp.]|uniref:type II toxin-antitoxin system VapB family antitoxin n=1 Tax=Haliscomenobacter sp. TaxID=2717303 RepID=UPI003BADA6D6
MRTNIVIDDALMTQAMSLSGLETKKAVVEEALKVFIQIQQQLKIRNFRGKLKWEGDLEQMRLNQ